MQSNSTRVLTLNPNSIDLTEDLLNIAWLENKEEISVFCKHFKDEKVILQDGRVGTLLDWAFTLLTKVDVDAKKSIAIIFFLLKNNIDYSFPVFFRPEMREALFKEIIGETNFLEVNLITQKLLIEYGQALCTRVFFHAENCATLEESIALLATYLQGTEFYQPDEPPSVLGKFLQLGDNNAAFFETIIWPLAKLRCQYILALYSIIDNTKTNFYPAIEEKTDAKDYIRPGKSISVFVEDKQMLEVDDSQAKEKNNELFKKMLQELTQVKCYLERPVTTLSYGYEEVTLLDWVLSPKNAFDPATVSLVYLSYKHFNIPVMLLENKKKLETFCGAPLKSKFSQHKDTLCQLLDEKGTLLDENKLEDQAIEAILHFFKEENPYKLLHAIPTSFLNLLVYNKRNFEDCIKKMVGSLLKKTSVDQAELINLIELLEFCLLGSEYHQPARDVNGCYLLQMQEIPRLFNLTELTEQVKKNKVAYVIIHKTLHYFDGYMLQSCRYQKGKGWNNLFHMLTAEGFTIQPQEKLSCSYNVLSTQLTPQLLAKLFDIIDHTHHTERSILCQLFGALRTENALKGGFFIFDPSNTTMLSDINKQLKRLKKKLSPEQDEKKEDDSVITIASHSVITEEEKFYKLFRLRAKLFISAEENSPAYLDAKEKIETLVKDFKNDLTQGLTPLDWTFLQFSQSAQKSRWITLILILLESGMSYNNPAPDDPQLVSALFARYIYPNQTLLPVSAHPLLKNYHLALRDQLLHEMQETESPEAALALLKKCLQGSRYCAPEDKASLFCRLFANDSERNLALQPLADLVCNKIVACYSEEKSDVELTSQNLLIELLQTAPYYRAELVVCRKGKRFTLLDWALLPDSNCRPETVLTLLKENVSYSKIAELDDDKINIILQFLMRNMSQDILAANLEFKSAESALRTTPYKLLSEMPSSFRDILVSNKHVLEKFINKHIELLLRSNDQEKIKAGIAFLEFCLYGSQYHHPAIASDGCCLLLKSKVSDTQEELGKMLGNFDRAYVIAEKEIYYVSKEDKITLQRYPMQDKDNLYKEFKFELASKFKFQLTSESHLLADSACHVLTAKLNPTQLERLTALTGHTHNAKRSILCQAFGVLRDKSGKNKNLLKDNKIIFDPEHTTLLSHLNKLLLKLRKKLPGAEDHEAVSPRAALSFFVKERTLQKVPCKQKIRVHLTRRIELKQYHLAPLCVGR